jgi:hypothetical protein
MLHESNAPDDQRAERDPDGDEHAGDAQDERSEARRRAQEHDPESPGATIDTDHPAEPNEPA